MFLKVYCFYNTGVRNFIQKNPDSSLGEFRLAALISEIISS